MKKIKIALYALLTLTMVNCSDDFLDKHNQILLIQVIILRQEKNLSL